VAPAVGHGAVGSPGIRCGVKVTWVGAPALMVKKELVAPARPVAVADRLYALPLWAMLRSAKVATTATAATVVVPERVAPLVPVPAAIVSVTSPAKLVAACPEASRTVTWTAGLMVTPAVVLPGWALNTSAAASAAVMWNDALV